MTADALSESDRIALQIGRIAQVHVKLDAHLRDAWAALVTPTAALMLIQRDDSTRKVADDVRRMLDYHEHELGPRFMSAAFATLDAAAHAGTLRNKAVHDMWIPEGDGRVLHTQRPSRRASELTGFVDAVEPVDLEEALIEIRAAWVRVQALTLGLWAALPYFRESMHRAPDEADLEQILVQMEAGSKRPS